jgi:dienelactone hydrolase
MSSLLWGIPAYDDFTGNHGSVYAYDMFGFGESVYHAGAKAHFTPLAGTVQTWSSMRVVDFLISLKEVDPQRIGMTGVSGGGTQTFLAAALDDRIAVSAPVVQRYRVFSREDVSAKADVLCAPNAGNYPAMPK